MCVHCSCGGRRGHVLELPNAKVSLTAVEGEGDGWRGWDRERGMDGEGWDRERGMDGERSGIGRGGGWRGVG